MLDMFTYWVLYGLCFILMWSFIVYWTFPLVDKYIESLTDGDLKNYTCNKTRNPFMVMLGLSGYTDYKGNPRDSGEYYYLWQDDFSCRNNTWGAVFVFWLSLLGLLINTVVIAIACEVGQPMYITVGNLCKGLVPYIGCPTLILTLLFISHTLLKRVYKFGKKATKVLNKLNTEEN